MTHTKDPQRIALNKQVLLGDHLDAVVCAQHANIMMLSGYCPVVGTSIAIATPTSTTLIVPKDEKQLAEAGWADDVRTFNDGSLHELVTLTQAVQPVLADALKSMGLTTAKIGYEQGPWCQPSMYAAASSYCVALFSMLSDSAPAAELVAADETLTRLRLVKTHHEIQNIRAACKIAAAAFVDVRGHIRPGRTETEIASVLQARLYKSEEDRRIAGFGFCMSGPNASHAYKAYGRSGQRQVRDGDLVLVHCNSTAQGYWTDITRTYCLGGPTPEQRRMYQAIFEARQAALAAVHPGARAAEIDHAARSVLESHGYGKNFKHPVGHGVGFDAINSHAKPRLHPLSSESLQVGMVFNLEPAIYVDQQTGLRHCDMVAVGPHGPDLLTTFQNRPDELIPGCE
jgi:Xaa-Pro aminopeptidase